MKTENKNIFLLWAVIILAVLNITTFITIGYHVYNQNKTEVITDTTSTKSANSVVNYNGRYFKEYLGSNVEQMEKFRQFNPTFRQEVKTIILELKEKRTQMFNTMIKPNPDTIFLNQNAENIGNLHSKLKKITYQYYLNIKEICDKKQQVKLDTLFKELFINELPIPFPGKGGPGFGLKKWFNRSNAQ